MKDLEELLAKCEANAVSDSQIDTSELPEITDFSGFEPMHPEYFKAKKAYNWENSLLRTLTSMNNLNMFLTQAMFYMTTVIEKIDKNFLSNIILERACLLKEDLLVYLSAISTGIVEILKYARTGIKEWQNIEHREKYKQLSLRI